jgi:peptide deformylase
MRPASERVSSKPYPIAQVGHSILRQRAKVVPTELITTRTVQKVIDTMIKAMREAPGVGLAAPQIGVSLRIIVLEDVEELINGRLNSHERRTRGRRPFKLRVFINPTIRILSKKKAKFSEGCLSIPGFAAITPRYLEVEVAGYDRAGKRRTWRVKGWPARILQHEMDHLNGKLYTDRMERSTFAKFPVPVYAGEKAAVRFQKSLQNADGQG